MILYQIGIGRELNMTTYMTYNEAKAHRNDNEITSTLPEDAAGNPYIIYEYDSSSESYHGLSPRVIRNVMNNRA